MVFISKKLFSVNRETMNPFIQKLNTKLPCTVLLITLICSAIFVFNATKLNSWFIDDAGISFAYARNLAGGFGLVAQPGAAPVEGFSNPAWVFLLALVKLLGFDILASTKTISIIFSIGVLFLAALISYQITHKFFLTLIAASWIAILPSVVIWFVSGLENPFYVFLILLLVWLTLQDQNNRRAVFAGMIAALVGLTRPEGAVFLLIYLIINYRYWKPFLLSFFLLFGAYFGFRLVYFGYPLPNTYYRKAGGGRPFGQFLSDTNKNFWMLENGLFGQTGFWIGTIVITELFAIVIHKKKFEKTINVIIFTSAIAFFSYLLLPPDWMGELRFATPILTIFPILMICLIYQVLKLFPAKGNKPASIASILLLAIWLTTNLITDYLPRFENFRSNPTVPFSSIFEASQHISQVALAGGIKNYSVLQPDAGGALWLNEYKFIDLGGLTDTTIAKTFDKDQTRFFDYIFTDVKPGIIELPGKWGYWANLQGDPRFFKDYQALYSFIAPTDKVVDGSDLIVGIFIRKELITSENQLRNMKSLASKMILQ